MRGGLKKESKRIETLLGLHYFIHERIYKNTNHGYIKKDQALIVLRMHHNIPKDECLIILRGLEILGLINEDGQYLKVKKPTESREGLILKFKKKLKLV
jgi:hypothetical protein